MNKPIRILLVEDNPADALLTREALKQGMVNSSLTHVIDGAEAVDYLFQRGRFTGATRPDLVLLDLNLPKKSGREVLAEVKADPGLRSIPIVILSTSQSAEDVNAAYELYANCYVSKPMEFDNYLSVVSSVKGFWGSVVLLPGGGSR